jgi:hypothetical protein
MRFSALFFSASLSCSLLLTGCAVGPTAGPSLERGVRLRGNVHGGQQPIAGSHVYLFAANTTGYGQPSISLLDTSATGVATDSVGAYVTTDANGGFSITGDYTCTAGTQVYIYALGGDPGAGINSAAGLLAVLGQCPASGSFASSVPFVSVNEVSTVAAAYAMAGFATDATHVSSSGTALAQTGIANAFANASNLADLASGSALTTTPAGNGIVPSATINALANILASCINTSGPSSTNCSSLFSNALSGGSTGATPTDTASAAINIAHNPGSQIAALFALPTATAPFAPALSSPPSDFTLALSFTGPTINQSGSVAIDASGDVWTFNTLSSGSMTVTKMSPSGSVLSGATGYVVGNDISSPSGWLAIDQNGDAWLTGASHIYKISGGSGAVSAFQPDEGSAFRHIAIDASGNVWTNSTSGTASLVELSPSGTDLHFTSAAPVGYDGIAISNSGTVWTSGIPYGLFGTSIATGLNLNVNEDSTLSFGEVALDATGNPWMINDSLTQFTYDSSSSTYSPTSTFSDGHRPSDGAIDGAGIIWLAADYSGTGIAAYSASGSSSNLYGMASGLFPTSLALDPSGDVWITNGPAIVEFIGASTPVVTPLSVGVKNNTLATRP